MNYPDITSTTAYQNLQWTGYIDGGLSLYQETLLERISSLESLVFDLEVKLDDVDDAEYIQDEIESTQEEIACLWRKYYESRGVA